MRENRVAPRNNTCVDRSRAVAFCGDVHLANHPEYGGQREPSGLNERGRLTVETLRAAADRTQGAPLVVCGDLFHHRRPEPSIIAAAQACLRGDDVVLPGNHDLMDASADGGNTACATLDQTSAVINSPTFWRFDNARPPMAIVPFDARKPMAEVIEDACAFLKVKEERGTFGLATHVGILDDGSPPWLREAPDAIHHERLFDIMQRHDIKAAFVGNYHRHGIWARGGMTIVQVGALNPTGYGDEGSEGYGGLAFWDGKTVEWESVPGPRFVRLKGGPVPTFPEGCRVFVKADRGVEAYEDLLVKHEDDKQVHVELTDPAPGVLEEIDAHAPDRVVDSAEEALKEYAAKAALPEGVGRAELLDEVQKYWRQA